MGKKQDEHLSAMQNAADGRVNKLQAAFIAAVKEIRDSLAEAKKLEEALAQKAFDEALLATRISEMDSLLFGIGLGNDAFVFSNQLTETFNLGAVTGIKQLPESIQRAIGYDTLNSRAVDAIKSNGTRVIQELTNSSKQAMNNLIQRLMSENIPPAKMGREIRQLIGLTDSQAQAVTNFRLQLETRQLLGFSSPDERRLNAIEAAQVRRHMREGSLSDTQIDEMVEKYYQRLLNKRALDIARTESMHSINQGQQEAWMQGLDQGVFDINKDRKFWLTAGDEKVRETHRVIPGMNPQGRMINEPFITPFGLVTSPGDYNIGLINCRCTLILSAI